MARLITVDARRPSPEAIEPAAVALAEGALVAFPTETVYGLGAHALDRDAITRVFRAKARPPTDPVIVHLAETDRIATVARDVPAIAADLARAFWPGPLTLILHKRPSVPDEVTAGLPTVAVRVPAHPVARLLIDRAGIPVAAPSANRFSRPSPTTAAHVIADLGEAIDWVIDAGPTPIGIESTVLDLTVTPPLVRRPGGIALAELAQLIPDVRAAMETQDAGRPMSAPGQTLRHYAPRAPLTLYLGEPDRVPARMADAVRAAAAAGRRVGVLAPEEDLLAMAPRLAAAAAAGRIVTARCGSRRHPAAAARDLFAALRDLDAAGVDEIVASAPAPEGLGAAIVDRLTRAAEGRVVIV